MQPKVFLYMFIKKKNEGLIEKIAKDNNSRFIHYTQIVDDSFFIIGDDDRNIITFKKNSESSLEEERKRLIISGSFHLGDTVNKIGPGSLIMKNLSKSEYSKIKSFVFGTISGSIGIMTLLDEGNLEFFLDLQNSIPTKGLGGLSLSEFRRDLSNFIDGDFIESFLELDRKKQEQIKSKMKSKLSLEEIISKIEDLSNSLH